MLREVVKHSCVDHVTLVEIDEVVVKVAKKFLPAMAAGFQHPKVTVYIGDGFEYLKENQNSYDVIITDSSDPVGPAEALFQESFYGLMHKALLPGGIICTQGISYINSVFYLAMIKTNACTTLSILYQILSPILFSGLRDFDIKRW